MIHCVIRHGGWSVPYVGITRIRSMGMISARHFLGTPIRNRCKDNVFFCFFYYLCSKNNRKKTNEPN